MSKQELDLFEVPSSLPAKLRAGPPKIMRREFAEVGCLGIAHHQPPDCFLIPDFRPGELAGFADRPKKAIAVDPGCLEPGIDARLGVPSGNGR